jgi:hypothetical protein
MIGDAPGATLVDRALIVCAVYGVPGTTGNALALDKKE